MTLLDFEELAAYWAEHPPLHILVAGYLGLGREKRNRMRWAPSSAASAPSERGTGADVGALLAELGPGFGAGDVQAGLAPVVLDFAELRRRAQAID